MFDKLKQIWHTKDIRNSILFVLGILVIIRVLAHVPIPGVDPQNLRAFFASNQILGLLNIFSGGSMESFSVIALGVGPYITASIIFQLLAMIFPRLEEMQKDGSAGQQKINQYTRIATVPLCLLQAYGIISILRQSQRDIIGDLSLFQFAMMAIVLTTGTMLLMWLGELISEKKIGNGISIIIFAGIISQLPTIVQQAALTFDMSQIINMLVYVAIGVVTIAGVVLITEGQRNVPVVYAKQQRGGGQLSGSVETHLPLRVNLAGVIPIIFAISIILFPPLIAQFFVNAKTAWLASLAQQVIVLSRNQLLYGITYFILVFVFTYFYTAVVFHPDQIAENLQKQGGFVPGIRPGRPTAEYLMKTLNRITPAAALFLAIIAVLPLVVQQLTGTQTLVIGGTSLLIVVSVVIEIITQINSHLSMHEYDVL